VADRDQAEPGRYRPDPERLTHANGARPFADEPAYLARQPGRYGGADRDRCRVSAHLDASERPGLDLRQQVTPIEHRQIRDLADEHVVKGGAGASRHQDGGLRLGESPPQPSPEDVPQPLLFSLAQDGVGGCSRVGWLHRLQSGFELGRDLVHGQHAAIRVVLVAEVRS
jgi:hypothetical protein